MSVFKRTSRSPKGDAIADEAALWVARRDRGLSAQEQDEYLQWLTGDPRRAEEVTRHVAAFKRMMRLHEWQPGHSLDPNPDLFAPQAHSNRRPWAMAVAAVAALAVSTVAFWSHLHPDAPAPSTSYLQVNESRVLPDGSIVELKEGSTIETAFSGDMRRVFLSGEAHFTVAKGSDPFVVEAANVRIRALGTAFNVRLDSNEVDVLVTEGTVRVDRVSPGWVDTAPGHAPQTPAAAPEAAPVSDIPETLSAGQRATVPRLHGDRPRIRHATAAEIERALGWQAPRLRFSDTPLASAIGEFNQRNRTRLVLAERELGSIPIGGTFRVDNVEGFVRLLEVTLDIHAEPRAGGIIILSRRRE